MASSPATSKASTTSKDDHRGDTTDKEIVQRLIGGQLPSGPVNLVLVGNYERSFALTGRVLDVGETSLIFETRQRKSAISYSQIQKIELRES